MTNAYRALMFVMLLGFSSCKETTTETTIQPFDFPLSVGSTWTFATYDSISLARDTVEVRIIGTTQVSNGMPATLWRYKYTNRVDTLIVARYSDTVVFYSHAHAPMLLFPMKVGNAWGRQLVDTFTVASEMLVSLPSRLGAIIAYHAFIVEQKSLLPNDYSSFEYWVVPNIGIVKMLQQDFVTVELTRTNITWTLLYNSISP
jgi:hypothetical protein